jgi:hypothetical protein
MSVYSIMYDSLGFHVDCARRVLKKMAEEHKHCPYNDYPSSIEVGSS